MNRYHVLATFLSCLLTVIPAIASDHAPAVAGNTAFAVDLYAKLRAVPGNQFLSPYSLSMALNMTYGGARGITAREMASVLHITQPQNRLHSSFGLLQDRLNRLENNGEVCLAIANSLWPQKGYDFSPEYLDLCRTNYGVTIVPQDYIHSPKEARQAINDWAAKQTNHKITELIPQGVLDETTRLVLTNAIYFKADWAVQFARTATRNEPFYPEPNKSVMAALMNSVTEAGYAEADDAQILRLLYVGRNLSMVVILPRKEHQLAIVESRLTAGQLQGWIRQSQSERKVQITLPRFKITREYRIDAVLKELGMPSAFDATRANFSGMDGHPQRLCLDAVLHKAFIEVNERGTEAAAASAVVAGARSSPRTDAPPVFRADHPFLFLICENTTGSVLFIGRVTDPT